MHDIVDTAIASGKFTTLVAALKAADLVTTLKGKGPFTVFAPTDDAFKKLPAGQVDDLLKPANKDKLKKILNHHVLAKKAMAADLQDKAHDEKMVDGSNLGIDVKGTTVKVGSASVITADVAAENGVIHIIDHVLIPH